MPTTSSSNNINNGQDAVVVNYDQERKQSSTTSDHVDVIDQNVISKSYFEDLSEDEDEENWLSQNTRLIQDLLLTCLIKKAKFIQFSLILIFCGLYTAYFVFSHMCKYESEEDIRLTWLTVLVVTIVLWKIFGNRIMDSMTCLTRGIINFKRKWNQILIRMIIGMSILFVIGMIILIAITAELYNLVSLSGILTIVVLGYAGSFSPRHVKWRPILVGLLLQFIFALLILRTFAGRFVFQYLGDRVSEFLNHTDAGSKFVFGEKYKDHFFVFKIMPVIIFFSTITSVLYYLGFMQAIIKFFAQIMYWTMGTTAGESMNAAANIFIGLTEAPLTIRPIIGHMTNSELHAVMTGGFATIAGGVFAAYLQFGIPANHLLAASVMSAPAALAMSKLYYPETKKSRTKMKDLDNMLSSRCNNIVEAAATGATEAVAVVANVVATLISFTALLHFLNGILTWFGDRACLTEPLTFQIICSYVLWPMAFLMGINVEDCRTVAELIGVKTFLNEFIAYDKLSHLIQNRQTFESLNVSMSNLTWIGRDALFDNGTTTHTFVDGFISRRSEVISTYALCGFSNISCIGIMVSGLSEMAPHRRTDISNIVVRALVAGTMSCFLTACIAGLLMTAELQ